jgi:uncharacterized protein
MPLTIATEILSTLRPGRLVEARIGVHWTAVVAEVDGQKRCGLASTQEGLHEHGAEPAIPSPGRIEDLLAREVVEWITGDVPIRRSLATAAINALLPPPDRPGPEIHAADAIARLGNGKTVALVGHFPFVPRLREQVARLWVLERNPQPGDEPEEAADHLLPQADVVALTGATFVNGSLDHLLGLCRPDTRVVMLGPSTPLSPVLFRHGVDVLSGSFVESIDRIVRAASQGANFHQLRSLGVRLVTITAPGIDLEGASNA